MSIIFVFIFIVVAMFLQSYFKGRDYEKMYGKKEKFYIQYIGIIFTASLVVISFVFNLVGDYFEIKEMNVQTQVENSIQENIHGTEEEIDNCFKQIKYGPDARVWICYSPVGSFYKLIGISGSIVQGAWWNSELNYMIVNLRGINYHYCNFNNNNWVNFSKSNDKDKFYLENIKSKFDCRDGGTPKFCDSRECLEENIKALGTDKSIYLSPNKVYEQ